MIEENPTLQSLLSRTSVRRFTDEPLSAEEVEALLRAAMSAPSSMNLQPWEFIVIDDAVLKRELRAVLPFAKMMTDATTGIVVCGDISVYEHINRVDREDNTLYWVQDCSAASENLLLAAHALGLGAVWTGVYPLASRMETLRALLHIPARVVPLNLIVVGHPAMTGEAKNKWDERKIHHNHF